MTVEQRATAAFFANESAKFGELRVIPVKNNTFMKYGDEIIARFNYIRPNELLIQPQSAPFDAGVRFANELYQRVCGRKPFAYSNGVTFDGELLKWNQEIRITGEF